MMHTNWLIKIFRMKKKETEQQKSVKLSPNPERFASNVNIYEGAWCVNCIPNQNKSIYYYRLNPLHQFFFFLLLFFLFASGFFFVLSFVNTVILCCIPATHQYQKRRINEKLIIMKRQKKRKKWIQEHKFPINPFRKYSSDRSSSVIVLLSFCNIFFGIGFIRFGLSDLGSSFAF